MTNRIVAVVLTYNRKELLAEVIQSLLSQSYSEFDIIIIDNHSTDDTKKWINSYLELANVFYVDTGNNLGGAGGFNYAIRTAVERGYERVWIMDDDCIPNKDALLNLVQADQELDGDFGWLSSLAFWIDGSLCKLNEHDYKLGKRIRDYSKNITPAITGSFVSLYVPTEVIENVGLNIKEFYMWADDWDFTRRISRIYPCYVISGSKVVHKTLHNKGNNIATDDPSRIWRYRYAYRNEVYVLRQDGIKGFIHWILKLGFHTIRILIQSNGNRLDKLKIMYGGAKEGLRFSPEIEYVKKAR